MLLFLILQIECNKRSFEQVQNKHNMSRNFVCWLVFSFTRTLEKQPQVLTLYNSLWALDRSESNMVHNAKVGEEKNGS